MSGAKTGTIKVAKTAAKTAFTGAGGQHTKRGGTGGGGALRKQRQNPRYLAEGPGSQQAQQACHQQP